MRFVWRNLLIVVPVIAGALLLAACGGGGEENGEAPAETPAAVETPTVQPSPADEEAPTVGLETYVCAAHEWNVSFPEGWLWRVTDGCHVSEMTGCNIRIFAPGTREVWVDLGTAGGWSESEFWTYFEIGTESYAEKGQLVRPPEYLSIDGVPGVRRDVSISPGRRTMGVYFLLEGQAGFVLPEGSRTWVAFEFDAPEEEFGAYEDAFERIAGSFRLGGTCPSAATPTATPSS